MDGLCKWIARVVAPVLSLVKKAPKSDNVQDTGVTKIDALTLIQESSHNSEHSSKSAHLPTARSTLRSTLNDMPAMGHGHSNRLNKDKHWFENQGCYDTSRPKPASNTWNRLEAFLSTTDPNRLTELDPSWNQKLTGEIAAPPPKPERQSELPPPPPPKVERIPSESFTS